MLKIKMIKSFNKKIKHITLIGIPLFITNLSNAQTESKNREHCNFVINKKHSKRIQTKFQLSLLNEFEKNEIIKLLYKKNNNTYKVVINTNNIISIYHISDVSVQYFKEYLITQNCFESFLSSNVIQNNSKY